MLVPQHRETDWIFSTESGHMQLLLNSPGISRLILIGNLPITADQSPAIYHRPTYDGTDSRAKLEASLTPLLIALSPKSSLIDGFFDIPFLSYEDNVICSVTVERCVGPRVGEMLVEDVEIEKTGEIECSKREFRRRLRFKRMPNLVQTEIRIVPERGFGSDCLGIGEVEFRPDLGVLVHPYLAPMVASLSLIGCYLDERIRSGFSPKALCVGVGGGALLGFLRTQLGFEVVGVEVDEGVLRVARQYFGLEDDEHIRVCVGDGIELIEKFARQFDERNLPSSGVHEVENEMDSDNVDGFDTKFDVIMVDLDSSDVGNGIIAPPLEFARKPVLLNARLALCSLGILVVNVIPPSSSFYETLLREFREVFHELYEIDVGNGENFVLIASASPIGTTSGRRENSFLKNLKLVISGGYVDSIRKI